LAWRDRKGNILANAGAAVPRIFMFSMSPDGRQAVVNAPEDPIPLWIYDLEGAASRRPFFIQTRGLRADGVFWFGGGVIYYNLFTRAGQRNDVFVKPADGHGESSQVPLPGNGVKVVVGTFGGGSDLLVLAQPDPPKPINMWLVRHDSDPKHFSGDEEIVEAAV